MRTAARFESVLRVGVIAGLVLYLAFLCLAVTTFPYDLLHAFEGNNLYGAWRIAEGKSPYASDQTTIPATYPYPPLFFIECMPGVRFFGADIRVVHWFSLLNILAAIVVLFREHRRRGVGPLDACLVAGFLFAHSYWTAGGPGIGLCDSLLVLLCALTLAFFVRATRPTGWIIAGVVAALVPLAKQTGISLPIALGAYLLYQRRWRDLATFAAAAITSFTIFNGLFVLAWGPSAFSAPWLEPNTSGQRSLGFLAVHGPRMALIYLPVIIGAFFGFYRLRRRFLDDPCLFAGVGAALIIAPSLVLIDPGSYYFAPAYLSLACVLPTLLNTSTSMRIGQWILAGHLAWLIFVSGTFWPPAPGPGDYRTGRLLEAYFSHFAGQEILLDRHQTWALKHNGDVAYDSCRLYGQWIRGLPHPWNALTRDIEAQRFGLIATSHLYERESAKEAISRRYKKTDVIQNAADSQFWYQFHMWAPRSDSRITP